MKLKNNSKNEWKNYNCGGGVIVDIPAEGTIEVSEKVGEFLLRVLGSEAWLTVAPAEEKAVKTERKVAFKVEKPLRAKKKAGKK